MSFLKIDLSNVSRNCAAGEAKLLQKLPAITPDQVKARMMKTAIQSFPTAGTGTNSVTGGTYQSKYNGIAGRTQVEFDSKTVSTEALIWGTSSVWGSDGLLNGTVLIWRTALIWGTSSNSGLARTCATDATLPDRGLYPQAAAFRGA